MNIRNSSEQSFNLWWRTQNLTLTKWCLETFKETNDERFLNWAKTFGNWSATIKNNYLTK